MSDVDIKGSALPPTDFAAGDRVLAESADGTTMKKIVAKSMIQQDVPAGTVAAQSGDSVLAVRAGAVIGFPYQAPEPLVLVNVSSGATRTLAASEDRTFLRMTHATPVLSLPLNATEAFPDDFYMEGAFASGGTIQGVSGVTVGGVDGGSITVGLEAEGSGYGLRRTASDTWAVTIFGAASGASIETALQGRTDAQKRANQIATQSVARASGVTPLANAVVMTGANDHEIVYVPSLPSGAPAQATSTAGAVELPFAAGPVDLIMSENLTTVDITGLALYAREEFRIVGHASNGYTIDKQSSWRWPNSISSPITIAAASVYTCTAYHKSTGPDVYEITIGDRLA